MTAYYNEIDPFAAQWLRNLIAAGHIAPGEVDERSIEDVQPDDVRGFTQCHWFAGIGIWSHALRSAGWEDTRPIWSGSCPCQPFSCAGKQLGTADKRHLWPAWFRLIRECSPPVVAGEQVAGPAALAWLDLVSIDLEDAGYAVGAADLCAASTGAPHIRQRLYWVANNERDRPQGSEHPNGGKGQASLGRRFTDSGDAGLRLAHADQGKRGWVTDGKGCQPHRKTPGWEQGDGESEPRSAACGMADSTPGGQRIDGSTQGDAGHATQREPACGMGYAECTERRSNREHEQLPSGREQTPGGLGSAGDSSRLANSDGWQPSDRELQRSGRHVQLPQNPLAGFWRDADWLPCADGKARPVEPGTFPLAHGVAGRVGRLRAYGNSLCAPVATEFVKAAKKLLTSAAA